MRLIDAEALSDVLEQMIEKADAKSWEYVKKPVVAHHFEMLKQQIEEILVGVSEFPTIEPGREKGKWIDSRDVCWLCSECGKWLDVLQGDVDMNFCPNCGSYNGGEQDG